MKDGCQRRGLKMLVRFSQMALDRKQGPITRGIRLIQTGNVGEGVSKIAATRHATYRRYIQAATLH